MTFRRKKLLLATLAAMLLFVTLTELIARAGHTKPATISISAASNQSPSPSRRETGTVRTAAQTLMNQSTRTITVNGLRRIYLLLRPVQSVGRLPLVILLHGRGLTPAAMVSLSGLAPLVAEGRAILAVPTGLGLSWNAGGDCCGTAGRSRPDDPAFVHNVVAAVLHGEQIDTSRIYLVGYSNGGKLALRMACEDPAAFAGIATYGAVPLVPCAQGGAVSVLLAAGTADQVLPYQGTRLARPPLMSVAAAVQLWHDRDGCPARPTTTGRVGPAEILTWRECRNHTAVATVIYHDLPHAWPAQPRVAAAASAATVIWDFFTGLPDVPAPPNPPAATVARATHGPG
ncbi:MULTISPECIES: PHB depolymerase family esterase [unclassified Frankia]|uniref:alpha/beta hydrolase family esterase n=1 Tax=unclassified Frankia TaxID=2632575 RepID=UPI001EF5711D|nr:MULTISPECIES: dienelactone hydrolase family protein [unclassified Frankia]